MANKQHWGKNSFELPPKTHEQILLERERINRMREMERIQGQKDADAAKAQATRDLISGDATAGIDFAKSKLGLGEGSLGRASTVSQIDETKFREMADGMDAGFLQASRDKAKEEINRSTQLQNRRLQALQSQQGIRGATAGSQQMSILQAGEKQKADFERDLFLKDREARIEGLQNLAEVQKYNQQQMVEQERFNLAQAAQEKYDLAQSGLAFSQLGLQERGSERAKEAQQAAAAASSGCFAEDTEVYMADGTTKPIAELKLGDRVMGGDVVYNYFVGVNSGEAYLYDGICVTGTHAVNHEGEFKRIEDIDELDTTTKVDVVFSVSTKNHKLIIKGDSGNRVEFADYDECYDVDLSGEDRLKILNKGI
jgi:hypothetical protein